MSWKPIYLLTIACIWMASSVTLAADDDDYRLTSASVRFATHDDNKDGNTTVSVTVTAIKGGDTTIVAEDTNFAGAEEFENPSEHKFDIPVRNAIKKGDINRLSTTITIGPKGNDRWIFDYTLTLTFTKGKEDKLVIQHEKGVILDQDYRTRMSGMWLHLPYSTDRLASTLKSAKIIFITPSGGDDKNADTTIDVDLSLPLDEKSTLAVASKRDFAGGEHFAPGSTHEYDLNVGTRITLGDYSRTSLKIAIHPRGNDRWTFEYKLILRFEGSGDPAEIIADSVGVILDQDNRALTVY